MAATALSTDLYELTMLAGYFAAGRHESVTATFELFVRRFPPHRNYLVAAGLEPLVDYLETLRFTDDDVRWLRERPVFRRVPEDFFEYLRRFRFEGDVSAVPEGTPVFTNEPLVRVTAPLGQAQVIETAALAFVNFQTAIASKAARIVHAAGSRPVMEFGARRAHGSEAALYAARAAYLSGFASTSYVEAGRRFGIPLSGTMAHSWILSAPSEIEAFRRYGDLFGESSALLLDTFDTVEAARAIVGAGLQPSAVRLDSGDMLALSRDVRQILDAGGLHATKILASGDVDEHVVGQLLSSGAPIDAFGVGTAVATSIDAPALAGVYKVVEVSADGHDRGVMKLSAGKETWPGRKQVWRVVEEGLASRDVVALDGESPPPNASPLLVPVMRGGRRTASLPALEQSRRLHADAMRTLPPVLLDLDRPVEYLVEPSAALRDAISSGHRGPSA
jgi:nicotinate phosphoribosyltransferase